MDELEVFGLSMAFICHGFFDLRILSWKGFCCFIDGWKFWDFLCHHMFHWKHCWKHCFSLRFCKKFNYMFQLRISFEVQLHVSAEDFVLGSWMSLKFLDFLWLASAMTWTIGEQITRIKQRYTHKCINPRITPKELPQ